MDSPLTVAQTSVTVVIPTFNRCQDLLQTLRALEAQTARPPGLEVVVVDDGSTDGTAEQLQAHAVQLNLPVRLISQENGGPAAARNRGVREATGDYIAFTDDDCVPQPTWIGELLAALPNDLHCAGVGGKVERFRDTLVSKYIDDRGGVHHGVENDEVQYLVTANALIRRELLLRVNGFDERFRSPASEDVDLSLRIRALGFHFRLAPRAVVKHRHRDTVGGLYRMFRLHGHGAATLAQTGRGAFRQRRLKALARKLRDSLGYLRRCDLTFAERWGFFGLRLVHIVADQIGYASGMAEARASQQ